MDRELSCDFYFGDKMGDVRKMDYSLLKNFRKEVKNVKLLPPIYWQKGALALGNKPYKKFIVLGEYYCLSTWLLAFWCKANKQEIYFWTHGWYGNESTTKKIVKKIFFGLADGLLLYGDYARRLMVKEGFSDKKLKVIYNSLDYSLQVNLREKQRVDTIYRDHFGNSDPVLVFIGRLSKVKKLEMLILAMKRLEISYHQPVNLILVGDGEERSFLEKEAARFGLSDRVWFYGALYDESHIANLIYNADICVAPGNVGLTAMHSMVYGTPVITHNDFKFQMPEFEAISPGVTGDFFDKGDHEHLAKKIYEWLENDWDRDEVRLNCFKVIDTYYTPTFQINAIKEFILDEADHKEVLQKH
ncbi:glycosyltransferase family 1 protein [Echinicola strongylocentroti]|uniref:Glycosyltransferase family 1 protein n=2 Tax=Echinicola strongylocentroti TaxID=1795355 RepID=A0A2Z4IRC5_9BACT|nr:glycosyltransferase family 1 protein [Echinicola strongylocentroti]